MKDLVEVQLPGDDLSVVTCVDKSRDEVSFTLLGDLPLDFRHSSTIGNIVSGVFQTDRRRFNSRH